MQDSIEIYKSGILRRGWRWRIKARNGKIICSSSESFKNKLDCEYNLKIVFQSLEKHFSEKIL